MAASVAILVPWVATVARHPRVVAEVVRPTAAAAASGPAAVDRTAGVAYLAAAQREAPRQQLPPLEVDPLAPEPVADLTRRVWQAEAPVWQLA